MLRALALALACAALHSPVREARASPYAGEESRPLKSLSDAEIEAYLAGKGMGFAKAAELNGYPGPAHVLELATPLGLSAFQTRATGRIFQRMQSQARLAGARLVEEERALERAFAAKEISPPSLRLRVRSIARLQGEIRDIHLQAHLEEMRVLNADQVAKYRQLRGYGAHDDAHSHHAE